MFKKRVENTQGPISGMVWRRFCRNPLAMGSLVFILLGILTATLGYLISPDSTPHANHQQLEIATHKPGHEATLVLVAKNQPQITKSFLERLVSGLPSGYNTIAIQHYWFEGEWLNYETYVGQPGYSGLESRIWLPDVAFSIEPGQESVPALNDSITFITYTGLKVTKPIDQLRETVRQQHIVSRKFLLGTDRFGRDLLSQLIIGARVSMSVGFISVFISLVIGLTLGSAGGYFRGWIDDIIVWLINVIWSIPTLLLVIAITFAIGKGFWQVFVAVGLTMWVEVARVARGQVLSIREKEYVGAAKALGLSSTRIIARHILPNIMGPIVVISAANFASAILIEAGLSFLGIGVQPPMPSWGTMIREHYGFIILDKGYLAFLPGLLIMLMVLAFMLLGNGLRDALDKTPRV